jgi:uncharacterized protein (TIGR03437 family)
VGDFNGDGKPDIAAVGSSGTAVAVLLGAGNGVFTPAKGFTVADANLVAAGDFNGDGKADLVVLSFSGGATVLLGNGDGTFLSAGVYPANAGTIPLDASPAAVVVGDFNGDGRPDIAVANTILSAPTHAISVLLGNGDGSFRPVAFYAAGSQPSSIVEGDFNGDGIVDLAVGGIDQVNVLLGNGDGTFRAARAFSVGGIATWLATADFNQDGKTDIAAGIAASTGSLILNMLFGNGDGTFSNGPAFSALGPFSGGMMAVEDFNGDGHADIAVAGNVAGRSDGGVTILAGNGDGTFRPPTYSSPIGTGPLFSIAAADLNGDARADVVTANGGSNSVSVLLASSSSALTVANTSLPGGMVGVPYSATLAAFGGVPPYINWSITGGAPPQGLTLNGATLAGTPVNQENPFGFTVTVEDSAGNVSPPQALRITLAPPLPAISSNGIAPINGHFGAGIEPGSWISIYGTDLAADTATWNGNFVTSLGGVTVTINGRPGYPSYVSPTQINLEAPDDTATGPVQVVVTNSYGSASSMVNLTAISPSLSVFNGGSYVAGIIPTPNGAGAYGGGTYDLLGPVGAFSFPTRPVKPGETLVLYGTGFGPTNPPVFAGSNFSGAATALDAISISIGGLSAKVLFFGVVSPGVFQINLVVPNAGSGNQPLFLATAGQNFSYSSSGLPIAVQ